MPRKNPMAELPNMTRILVYTIVVLLIQANVASASHPYHVSLTEVRWNPTSGNFEVALCVWPGDLELALARHTNSSVDLQTVANLDAKLSQYVAEHFSIHRIPVQNPISRVTGSRKNAELNLAPTQLVSQVSDIRWVGHELDLKQAWLYFEIPGTTEVNTWRVENHFFNELNEDQINRIQLSVGREVVAVDLNRKQPVYDFSTNQSAKRTHRIP